MHYIHLFYQQDSVLKLSEMFQLSQKTDRLQTTPTQQRNICVVLGCIAEKLAGPSSIAVLSNATLDYLINNLVNTVCQFKLIVKLIFVNLSLYRKKTLSLM